MPENKLIETLKILCEHEIRFIVVGGVAAVLNGAPIQTLDIDLVYAIEPANIDRLLKVMERLDGRRVTDRSIFLEQSDRNSALKTCFRTRMK